MTSLQEIGLAALIYNERWQEVRRELQWNPDIFRSFRLRHGNNHRIHSSTAGVGGDDQETVFHLLCSKGNCPLDILESVLNIAPDLVQINAEPLLQSLIQNQMWEIVLIVLKFYPDIVRTSLFATRQGHLVTTLHLLCLRHVGVASLGTCPPMKVVSGVIDAAPESLQWKGPGLPLHYAVHACCTEPAAAERRRWITLLTKILQPYPEGVAVSCLATQQQQPAVEARTGARLQNGGCTPLVLAVSLGASPHLVRLLLRSCPKPLLPKAGVHEAYRHVVKDPTLYLGRDDDRKKVLDSLRPSYYLPMVKVACTVPVLAAAAVQPRYLRTSLGAVAVFNLAGGSKWCLDQWERRRQAPPRGRAPVATLHRMDVPELVTMTSPGLSLKFREEAAHTLLPVMSPAASSSKGEERSTTSNDSPDACVVCWEGTADHVLIPCGHVCLCLSCSGHLGTTLRNKCPVCNGRVQQALKIFGAGIATNT